MVEGGQSHAAPGPVAVSRWHPIEERWEDADAPMPATPEAGRGRTRAPRGQEDRQSREYGHPEWEVRVTLPGRGEARELAERLQAEGIPVARRWHHLLIGANDEDQARELAERVRPRPRPAPG